MEWSLTSPREAARRIQATPCDTLPVESSVPLAEFQQKGVERAAAILQQRGGVFLADSVGLGKTFLALALADAALQRGECVAVVVPASLRRMWRRELGRIEAAADAVTLLSHTAVALGRTPHYPVQLLIVDEAHAFRNPRTRRYRALRRLCRASRVVLLTATPVNNALSDLYFQLRLFCADGAFRDIGIGSLRSALLGDSTVRAADLDRLRHAVMVRRTRAEVRASSPDIGFPQRLEAIPVSYQLPMPVRLIGELLHDLEFAAYRIDQKISGDLLRYGLLKRLESSRQAMRTTLLRQIRFHEQFLTALHRSRVLRPRTFRELFSLGDDSLQLVFDEIALEEFAPDTTALQSGAENDLRAFRRWLAALDADDDKLHSLIALLRTRPPDAKTIVFTEFRDTAHYIWRSLRTRFATGLVDGAGAWLGESPASRNEVVERFAPVANGARHHAREGIAMLVATDVLAEGMNLQDADAVVSYDLPWNPVKLIQRAGRVDRMGSPHDIVMVYNFIPDREFDAFLGLARTIRSKLETVRAAVGVERPVLEPDEPFDDVMRAVAAGDAAVLDRIESPAASSTDVYVTCIVGLPIASLAHAPRRLLVGLRCGVQKLLVVRDVASGQDMADGAEAILERAAACELVRPLDERMLRIAEDVLREVNLRSVQPLELGKRSAAAIVARLIRARLAELSLNENTDVYARADCVLTSLEGVSEVAVEDTLVAVSRRQYASLTELLAAAEKALSQSANGASRGPVWELTGVIGAD